MTTRLVAIDGPAGSGKSTVCRELVRELDGVMFSTGCIYRGATLVCLDAGVNLEDSAAVLKVLDLHKFVLEKEEFELKLRIDGQSRDAELHGTRVSREIHWVADEPSIRARLLPIQRDLARQDYGLKGPVVVEGRDIGTVVFPDADLKVFLTASVAERAHRRAAQLRQELGEEIDEERVRADVERRDKFDREREVAPLKVADDAVVVDTTDLSMTEVVSRLRELVESRIS